MNIENVIIIGGGPAGLSAAIYLARAGLKPLVFAGSPPGGQLTLTSQVENYPGFESILGAELIEKMRKQAERFGARVVNENLIKVDFSGKKAQHAVSRLVGTPLQNQRLLKSSKQVFSLFSHGRVYFAKSVIIATGAKALWLNLPSEQRLRGRGVSACATCDGFFFKDKVVGVVGGGDTALEEALTLTKFAKKVYLIHRRNEFRASKIIQKRVFENKKIEVIWNSEVEEIVGEQKVEAIKVKSQKSKVKNTSQNLKVDGVFIAIGHKPDTDLFKGQVEMDNHGYILTSNIIGLLNLNIENSMKIENCKLKIPKFDMNFTSQTSVPGVFAAGDCADPHYRQVATAVGMGVAAALEVEHWLEQA